MTCHYAYKYLPLATPQVFFPEPPTFISHNIKTSKKTSFSCIKSGNKEWKVLSHYFTEKRRRQAGCVYNNNQEYFIPHQPTHIIHWWKP